MIMDQTTSTSNSPQELTNISRRCSRWPVIIWYCTSLIRTNVKTNLEIRLFSSFQGCSLINYWCSNGLCCLSVCVCLLNWLLQPVAQVLRCCRFHMVILKMAQKWNWISELSLYICSESLGLSADRVREHTRCIHGWTPDTVATTPLSPLQHPSCFLSVSASGSEGPH